MGVSLATRLLQLRAIATFALTPLGLWYLFDWPLRLARHLARTQKAKPDTGHALDGDWPARTSFLDRIAATRTQPASVATLGKEEGDLVWLGDPDPADQRRPPALDRVAQLRPNPTPPDRD